MKTLKHNHGIRLACTAVLIFAWLIATNCCGLGLMGPMNTADAVGCSQCQQQPAEKQAPEKKGNRECCKSVNLVQLADQFSFKSAQSQIVIGEIPATNVLLPANVGFRGIPTNTGPPENQFLTENILPRCYPANAPPVSA